MLNRDSFWIRYLRLAEKRMKPSADFYTRLSRYYAGQRAEYDRNFKSEQAKALPTSTIRFANRLFRRAQKVAIGSVSADSKSLASEAYSFRLGEGDNGADLVSIDIFAEITQQQDLPIDRLLLGVQKRARDTWLLEELMAHSFFHKPQKTSLLFLHELLVGHLLYKTFRKRRTETTVRYEADYLETADCAVRALANFLDISVPKLVSLHFQTDADAFAIVPLPIRDLLTSAAHIYFRIETMRIQSGGSIYPAELLSWIIEFYLLPVLMVMKSNRDLRLVRRVDCHLADIFRIRSVRQDYVQDPARFKIFLAHALSASARRLWR